MNRGIFGSFDNWMEQWQYFPFSGGTKITFDWYTIKKSDPNVSQERNLIPESVKKMTEKMGREKERSLSGRQWSHFGCPELEAFRSLIFDAEYIYHNVNGLSLTSVENFVVWPTPIVYKCTKGERGKQQKAMAIMIHLIILYSLGKKTFLWIFSGNAKASAIRHHLIHFFVRLCSADNQSRKALCEIFATDFFEHYNFVWWCILAIKFSLFFCINFCNLLVYCKTFLQGTFLVEL